MTEPRPSMEEMVNNVEISAVEVEEYCPEGVDFAKKTLVGKVMIDKVLNRGAVKNILAKGWGEPEGLKITAMGPNIFMFIFKYTRQAHDILKKGPWYVMNHIISLQYWIPEASVYEVDFSRVSFWIQMQGMLLGSLTTNNVVKIR